MEAQVSADDEAFEEGLRRALEQAQQQLGDAYRDAVRRQAAEIGRLQEQVGKLSLELRRVRATPFQSLEGSGLVCATSSASWMREETSPSPSLPEEHVFEPPPSCPTSLFLRGGQEGGSKESTWMTAIVTGPPSPGRASKMVAFNDAHALLKYNIGSQDMLEPMVNEEKSLNSKSSGPVFTDFHPTASARVRSGLLLDSVEMRHRLHARLGHLDASGMINGRTLHQAVSALGLEKYSIREMEYLIHRIGLIINLRMLPPEEMLHSPHAHVGPLQRSFSAVRLTRSEEQAQQPPRAVWEWPAFEDESQVPRKLSGLHMPTTRSHSPEDDLDHSDAVLPVNALMQVFIANEVQLMKLLHQKLVDQVFAIKEVLLTGDTNRLVAELTCVHIDDLATRRPRAESTMCLEPIVAFMIVLNGLLIGMQTDPSFEFWIGWFWVEGTFTAFFLLEIVARACSVGFREHFLGHDSAWHMFDLFLVLLGILDVILTVSRSANITSPALLRFVRLARLSRLVQVFRLNFMRELQLMMKGILGGLRTLAWAFVLLLCVLYVLGVVTTMLFQTSEQELVRDLFNDVPTAMFTAFRCVSGDCFTRTGSSLSCSLYFEFGVPFAICFFLAYLLVTLGIFNVILAIYVEITMTAAKQTDDYNKSRRGKEAIRVAHITKQLLKMFCAAERLFNGVAVADRGYIDMHSVLASAGSEDIDVDERMTITKELFLLVIQDPEVQKLMDSLDIPPDRASLFDSIDADASGTLHATELVRGLLKIRGGELKKSDQVACVLALRVIQNTLKNIEATVQANQQLVMEHLGLAPVDTSMLEAKSFTPFNRGRS